MISANEIKQSVLLAAISGKLTKQIETDTNIDEYLLQLEIEKNAFCKTQKVRIGQDIDSISDADIPCDIPNSWRYVRLCEIVKSISAGGDKPKIFSKEKMLQCQVPVISNGESNRGIFGYTDKAVIKESALTVSGRGTIGYSVIRNEPFVPIVRLLVILPLKHTNLQYIQIVLSALVEYGSGTAVKQLTVPMISPKIIPLPPPEEQQRIVDRVNELLSKVDEFAEIENQLIELKATFPDDMRNAILQAAMQGKLTEQLETDSSVDELIQKIAEEQSQLIKSKKAKKQPQIAEISDEDIPFDIPSSWRWVRFGKLVNYNMGKTPPRGEATFWKDDFPWVSIADMPEGGTITSTKEKISDYALKEKFGGKFSHAGTLLMSFKLTVGRVSYLGIDAVHNEAIISIFPMCDDDNIISRYLFKILPFISQYGNSKDAIKGKTLNNTSIANLLIPLPPIEEQQRIVEKLDKLLKIVEYTKEMEV